MYDKSIFDFTGVMHLVSRAFKSVVSNNPELFSKEKVEWYEQILRLVALTHDLGHAPFSHGSESVLPEGLEHEDFTDRIILETEIGDYIREIGREYTIKYGSEYNITPELICSIYHGKNIDNPDFMFLRKFMDSELDCDKMDYLLRDSLYCGVNYGKYDLEKLISSLTVYKPGSYIFLAVEKGGIHAVEEFILARYFMFTQVYFHKTRRLYDKMLNEFLVNELPDNKYPKNTFEYIEWDDARVWLMMREKVSTNEWANRIINRSLIRRVYESPTHSNKEEKQKYNLIKNEMIREFGEENILLDSADKLPHKIPAKYEIDDEKAIPVIGEYPYYFSTLSDESEIIKKMTEPINILRIYAKEQILKDAEEFIQQKIKDMND